jgi:hypothetical protein
MKRSTLLAIVLVALLALTSVAGASRAAAAPMNSAYTELANKAAKAGTQLRLLVTLKTNYQPEGRLSVSGVSNQRAVIKAAQDTFMKALPANSYKLISQFYVAPVIALYADVNAINVMASDANVLNIEEDIPLKPGDAASNNVIGVPAAVALGFTGAGWAVAVLDSGVQTSHPFFNHPGKVVAEACFSSNSLPAFQTLCTNGGTTGTGGTPGMTGPGAGVNCPLTTDGCEHGSHVAGIAVGKDYPGGPGYSGVAREGRLIAIQVFTQFNNQSDCGTDPAPCIRTFNSDYQGALQWLASQAGSINIASANMSLGSSSRNLTPCDTNSTKPFVDNLISLNIATTISSGNSGFNDGLGSPGCISTAISVGSTDNTDAISSFSNRAAYMDVYAPGSGINSSVPFNTFTNLSGTSMAAPQVAGAWAVMKQKKPNGTVAEILAAFQSTGKPIPNTGGPAFSNPRIQLDAALNSLTVTATPTYTPGGPTVTAVPSNTPSPTPTLTATPGALVVTNLNDSGAGSLRDVVTKAGSGSTVTFAGGLTGTITLTSGEIKFSGALTITGPGARNLTINGNALSRIFNIDNAGTTNAVTISGLKLTNAFTIYGGGAVNVAGGSLVLDALTIDNNDGGLGVGPALYNADAAVTIRNTTISNNRAGNRGGIQNQGGAATNLTIINSTLSGNSTGGLGGVIRNFNALTIVHSTFFNNASTDAQVSNSGGVVTVGHSVFGGGTNNGIASASGVTSLGYNVVEKPGTVVYGGTDVLNQTVNLQSLANNGGPTDTHQPNAGSPVLERVPPVGGCNNAGVTTDQRGITRPQGTNCEAGALENNITSLPTATNTATPTSTPSPTPFVTGTISGFMPAVGCSTFDRPTSGNPPTTLSGVIACYDAKGFMVSQPGVYTITMISGVLTDAPSNDAFGVLYRNPFDKTAPLTNVIVSDDDSGPDLLPSFVVTLQPAQPYILVATTFDAGVSGTYTWEIKGPSVPTAFVSNSYTATHSAACSTFNRPAVGMPPTALSGVGTAVCYHAQAFTVPVSGLYKINQDSNTYPDGDGFMALYEGQFIPSSPLTNALAADDDSADPEEFRPAITINLTAGTTYVIVSTTYDNGVYGDFTNSVTGPGLAIFTGLPTPTATFTASPTIAPSNTPTNTPTLTRTPTRTNTPTITPIPIPVETIGVFNSGVFYLRMSNSAGAADFTTTFGNPTGDYPVVGDWNNDGVTTVGVYRQAEGRFILSDTNVAPTVQYNFIFGNPGDEPLSGHWDFLTVGDGVGVYRYSNGILYLRNSKSTGFSDYFMILGNPDDYAIAGDWNGDGFDSVGVFRDTTNTWYLANTNGYGITFSDISFVWDMGGTGFNAPLAGDWNGDNISTVAQRNVTTGTFALHSANAAAGTDTTFIFGPTGTGSYPLSGVWGAGALGQPPSSLLVPVNYTGGVEGGAD